MDRETMLSYAEVCARYEATARRRELEPTAEARGTGRCLGESAEFWRGAGATYRLLADAEPVGTPSDGATLGDGGRP
jgi:hypothetical protein